VAAGAETLARRVRSHTAMPLAIGFGVSRPEHVAAIGAFADAAVVGSSLVSVVAEHGSSPDLAEKAAAYVRWLKGNGG
jgi:tryptophan synthase alpha chain